MDPRLVQRSRYLLQARVRRAKSCPRSLFAASCAHLLAWSRQHPILAPMVAELANGKGTFKKLLDDHEAQTTNEWHVADTLQQHAVLSLCVLERVATARQRGLDEDDVIGAMALAISGRQPGYEEACETLRDVAVDGLYEWL